jgi:hypothetical protein
MLLLVGALWGLTGICALTPWDALNPPDRWYQGLETFTATIVIQFIGKRWTNGRGTNGNGSNNGNGAAAAQPA